MWQVSTAIDRRLGQNEFKIQIIRTHVLFGLAARTGTLNFIPLFNVVEDEKEDADGCHACDRCDYSTRSRTKSPAFNPQWMSVLEHIPMAPSTTFRRLIASYCRAATDQYC